MKTIYVNNTELSQDKRFTYLASDVSSGGTALVVQSIIGFQSLTTSSGQIICIGEIGNEKTEILRTDQNNAPSGSTVSLRDSLQFDHPQDTKVYIFDWNRVEIQHASTVTGSKSTIKAYPLQIQADLPETLIQDSTQTSGYYFTRFNETIGNTNSDWSDPIPYGGFSDDTVFSIKRRALLSLGETVDGAIITEEYLNASLWEARRELHQAKGKRPFRRKFNTDIGNVTAGMYRIDLPTDCEKPFTGENVYGVRIGTEANMEWQDKKEWDFYYRNKPHSTLSTAYSTGDQDLYVTNVRDFSDSGAVTIENDSIAYSARGLGGTLRISTAGSTSHDSGSDVWQNISYGLPDKFTVFADPNGSAYIYFNRPLDTAYVNQNIYADYYRKLVEFDSDADQLDEPNYDLFVNYLAWKIKKRKDRGLNPLQDPDFQEWTKKKNDILDSEYGGVEIRISPNISHLDFPR